MIEIVTVREFLMLLAAVGGRRAILPDFGDMSDGLSPDTAAADGPRVFTASEETLETSHRVLLELLRRGLLKIENGRAVPERFAMEYFHVFKNASTAVCVWPKEPEYPPVFGYIVPPAGSERAALLERVDVQPGAWRIWMEDLAQWRAALVERMSEYFLPPVDEEVVRTPFDGLFAAAPLELGAADTLWVADACPAGQPFSEDNIRRRLTIKTGGLRPMIYEEGRMRETAPGSKKLLNEYLKRLMRPLEETADGHA